MTVHRIATAARVQPDPDDPRRLDVTIVPYDVVARVSDDGGRTFYDESWQRGSLVADGDRIPVYAGHRVTAGGRVERGPLIGRLEDVHSQLFDLAGTVVLARTQTAADVHELAGTVSAGVSLEADCEPHTGGGTIVRSAADPARLTGLAVILPPDEGAYGSGSLVTAVRAKSRKSTTNEETTMSDDATPTTDAADTGDDASVPQLHGDPPHPTIGRSEVAELVRRELARVSIAPGGAGRAHPAAQWSSFGEYAAAVWRGDTTDVDVIARVLADQTTDNNPGVIPPNWLSDVKGIVNAGRPAITAIGTEPAGGLAIHFPYFNGTLLDLVDEQTAEKQLLTSVRVDLLDGNVNLKTYGGASDVSFQLRDFSSPSYMNAYMRIMMAAYNARAEHAAQTQLEAAATAGTALDATTATLTDLNKAMIVASRAVRNATGSPATYALAATDVVDAFAGIDGIFPAQYGVQNVVGTADAATLQMRVSGLPIIEAPHLTAGALIVSNGLAASWHERGPLTLSQDVVGILGTDVAVYGYGVLAAYTPAGIIDVPVTTA